MMFLIDGPRLGHGLMAFEALSARVPILAPSTSHGAYLNFLKNSELLNEKNNDSIFANSVFSDERGLQKIVRRIKSEKDNKYLGKGLYVKFKDSQLRVQQFEDFITMIKNSFKPHGV